MDNFDLEHSILEERARRFEALEFPITKRVFLLLAVSVGVLGMIAGGRVLLFASSEGDFYEARAEANMTEAVTIPAARGIVYDRFGIPLAVNEASHRLVLNAGMAKRSGVDVRALAGQVAEIAGIEKEEILHVIQEADLQKNALVTLVRNISPDQMDRVRELGIPALEIHDDLRREYPMGPVFAHVLGYTGLAKFQDLRGKTGLEQYYDEVLAGTDGVRLVYRDARGDIMEEKFLDEPRDGTDVHTALDAGLQEYIYNRLAQGLTELGRDSGAVIAMHPQTGEVLAMVSMPSFDANIFTDPDRSADRARVLHSSSRPLFNRALSGAYAPGSTVKPLVALASLYEQVISPTKKILSTGSIEIPNPYFPDQPSRFVDWKPHGWVDVRSALARSSNVYFYAAGGGFPAGVGSAYGGEGIQGLGIEKLKSYWEFFGFGEKTGIDLGSEGEGFLPDPGYKEQVKNDIWRIGDTYNVSIGQGDLLVTPLQLVNNIASIANGGKIFRPYLTGNSALLGDFSYMEDVLKEVQEGMRDAVRAPYGTANLLANLPIQIAGKTGSAQTTNNTRTNAFFAAYGPYENPEIAILVLIENAREGSLNAVPIGKDIMEWYYYNRIAKGL